MTCCASPSPSPCTASVRFRERQAVDAASAAAALAAQSSAPRSALVAASLEPTFTDASRTTHGCRHYARKCKLWASGLGAYVTCRLCHDEALGVVLDRHAVEKVLCMLCKTEQEPGRFCVKEGCEAAGGDGFGKYFCEVCRLYNDGEGDMFHCEKCGICRLGKREENYHCEKCEACVAEDSRDVHMCTAGSLHSECPVCREWLFTSRRAVRYMRCGHAMHAECWDMYTLVSYVCPICKKSLADMQAYYDEVDVVMERERGNMPPECQERVSRIYCNECDRSSETPFHFEYHKCSMKLPDGSKRSGEACGSYNTTVL